MAGFNTLDTTGFDNAIEAFKKAMESYNEARSTLKDRAANLRNNWSGEGGSKYKSVSNKILQLLEDDGESLSYVIQNLEEIRRLYGEADQQIAKNIQQADVN